MLGTTNHRFLIKLYHAFQTATQLCFVMEFAQGKNTFCAVFLSKMTWRHQYHFHFVFAKSILRHRWRGIYHVGADDAIPIESLPFLRCWDYVRFWVLASGTISFVLSFLIIHILSATNNLSRFETGEYCYLFLFIAISSRAFTVNGFKLYNTEISFFC